MIVNSLKLENLSVSIQILNENLYLRYKYIAEPCLKLKSCLSLLRDGSTNMCHHTQQEIIFQLNCAVLYTPAVLSCTPRPEGICCHDQRSGREGS